MTRRAAALVLSLATLALGCEPAAPAWGPSSLSFFEPAPEGLAWVRFDPDAAGEGGTKGRRALITTIPTTGGTPDVAWRADGGRALVWQAPRFDEVAGAERPATIWDVDVASGAKTEVPVPPAGKLDQLGFDAAGRAIALVEAEWAEGSVKQDAKGRYLEHEGRRVDVPADMLEGLPILVHAFELTPERTWKALETIASDTGWDYASGVKRLAAAATLGARTPGLLSSHPDTEDLTDKAALAPLEALAPRTRGREDGNWAKLVPSDGRVAVWLEQAGEFMHATELLAFTTEPPALVPHLAIPSPAAKAMISGEGGTGARGTAPQVRGDRLLVADAWDGEHPRLIDLATRQLLFSSDVARATVFWPETGAAATAGPSATPTAAPTAGATGTPLPTP